MVLTYYFSVLREILIFLFKFFLLVLISLWLNMLKELCDEKSKTLKVIGFLYSRGRHYKTWKLTHWAVL